MAVLFLFLSKAFSEWCQTILEINFAIPPLSKIQPLHKHSDTKRKYKKPEINQSDKKKTQRELMKKKNVFSPRTDDF